MDFSEFCRQLIDKTDIVRVISRYVNLTPHGRDYVAPCPFHNEKKPSFRVNVDKQFFYCFGCKVGGDVIQFVSEIERIDRIDAIKLLADEAGMELPKLTGTSMKVDKEKRFRLYALMKDAAIIYHQNLKLSGASRATKYIEKREIPQNIVTRFGLGYSHGSTIVEKLKQKGYTNNEMMEAGIALQKVDKWYDVFSGRLIFPIISNVGEVVAFGGRALSDEDFPKYRNSTNTEIFDKSRTVYALNLLKKKTIKEGKLDHIIICEGYMDVIALNKGGFENAVASMGTALTLNQARQLKNYTDKVVICYDGDLAGQKATLRGLDILKEAGLIVKVADMPKGMDPDDIINKMGANAYKDIISNAMTLTAYKLKSIASKYNLDDLDEKSRYTLEAIKCINELSSYVEVEQYLKQLQAETGYSMEVLKRQAESPELIPAVKPIKRLDSKQAYQLNANAVFVLASVLSGAKYAVVDEQMVELMPDDFSKQVVKSIIELRLNGAQAEVGKLYCYFDESDYGKLSTINDYEFIEGDNEIKYKDCLNSLKCEQLTEQIKKLESEMNSGNMNETMKEIQKLNLELRNIRNGGKL